MREDEMRDQLRELHDFAHDHSAGPEVPDYLWEVRNRVADILALLDRAESAPKFKALDLIFWTSKYGTEFRGAVRHINAPEQVSYYIDLNDGTSVQRAVESDLKPRSEK